MININLKFPSWQTWICACINIEWQHCNLLHLFTHLSWLFERAVVFVATILFITLKFLFGKALITDFCVIYAIGLRAFWLPLALWKKSHLPFRSWMVDLNLQHLFIDSLVKRSGLLQDFVILKAFIWCRKIPFYHTGIWIACPNIITAVSYCAFKFKLEVKHNCSIENLGPDSFRFEKKISLLICVLSFKCNRLLCECIIRATQYGRNRDNGWLLNKV